MESLCRYCYIWLHPLLQDTVVDDKKQGCSHIFGLCEEDDCFLREALMESARFHFIKLTTSKVLRYTH